MSSTVDWGIGMISAIEKFTCQLNCDDIACSVKAWSLQVQTDAMRRCAGRLGVAGNWRVPVEHRRGARGTAPQTPRRPHLLSRA